MSLSQLMPSAHIGHLAHWHSHCVHAPGQGMGKITDASEDWPMVA